jgi:hypothetical protein
LAAFWFVTVVRNYELNIEGALVGWRLMVFCLEMAVDGGLSHAVNVSTAILIFDYFLSS